MKRASLNHCYRLVWSEPQASWVVAPESAKGRGKGGQRLLAVALLAPALALAAPNDGVVTSGTASIRQGGAVTNINQSSQKASINWQGFSVGAGETVNFNQPNASAVTLNRVIGKEKSVIDGALNANGQVFLINSNGVLFGKGSSVNVGGLVASTRNLSDADFNAGNYVFKGEGNGAVINLGTLTARDGGYVALLGNNVSNQGGIAATRGTVALSGGDRITLNFNGDSLISVSLDEGTLNALVENRQAIYADGGTVYLTAKAADELLGAQVNNSGIVRARSVDDLKGRIELYAHGGTANIDGTLDASAPSSGDGGFVETSGRTVNVADGAFVTTRAANGATGTWLIDPNDFTVAASGGNMTGAAIASALANNNYTISTQTMGTAGGHGDIDINDAIAWSSSNRLTLTAERDININNAITANGASAGLTLTYGRDYNIRTKASYAGAMLDASGSPIANADTSGGAYGSVTFSSCVDTASCGTRLTINGTDYTLIGSMSQLDMLDGKNAINGSGTAVGVNGNYALARNLDAAGTAYTNALIGVATTTSFSGTLTGLGHAISNLTISAPNTASNIGLFGTTLAGSTIRDLGLVNADVTGRGSVGTLVGWAATTAVKNAYATGSVTSNSTLAGTGNNIGGLIGRLQGGSIDNAYTDVTVYGWTVVGGLLGIGQGNGAVGVTISNAHALGSVTGRSNTVGGLVGNITGAATAASSIVRSYAKGDVTNTTGGNYQGGLVGMAGNYSSISYSFATGNVSIPGASNFIGGLIGQNYGALDHVHATGAVAGKEQVGGLVGNNMVNSLDKTLGGTIDHAYATGNVSGQGVIGGLVGQTGQFTRIGNAHASGSVTATVGGIAGGFIGGNYGTIADSYATGNVASAGPIAGGFAGLNSGVGTIRNAHASGNVEGGSSVGGFAGQNFGGTIDTAYATGGVKGDSEVGGLIGQSATDAGVVPVLTNSYATGHVTGATRVGGLVGYSIAGTGSNNAWNMDSSGQDNAVGSTSPNGLPNDYANAQGLTNEQFKDVSYYLDGTINQVLAERAAVAAREQAFRDEGSRIAGNERGQALNGPPPKPVALTEASPRSLAAAALDQNIVFSSSKYSADVRTIEVDGKVFKLQDVEDEKRPASQPK